MNMDKITNKIKFGISNINNLLLKSMYKFKLLKEDPKFIISEPPKIITNQSNDINIDRIKQEYRQLLKDFILTMKDNVSQELLKTMYNNLSTLDINNSLLINIVNFIINKKGYEMGGAYSILHNKIKLSTNTKLLESKIIIFHELLHMSSSVKNKKGTYSGFYQHYYNTKEHRISYLGRNVNEGYTELLTERYFNQKKIEGIYGFYREITQIIENIIGKEKMTNLYFNSNLNGLIEELSKYSTKEEVLMFIYNLDNNKSIECFNYVNNIYLNKLTTELTNNTITNEEAIQKLKKYDSIINTIEFIYSLDNKEETKDIIRIISIIRIKIREIIATLERTINNSKSL